MMIYPLISIQILNWNRAEETQRAIKSAYEQTYPNLEVVLVDNGSSDNSIALTKKNFPGLKIVELEKNYGCPGGRNLGIPFCSGKYIFYLDNDGVLHKEAVKNAYSAIISGKDIGVVTGVVYDFDNLEEIDSECEVRNNSRYQHHLFQGGICMHDKDIYKEVGLYPTHFMYGGEESFLSLRLLDSRFKIVKDESVILWHKRSDVARNRKNEILNSYFNTLYTAIALYPNKYAFKFGIYFLLRYPFYASKNKILIPFLKKLSVHYFQTVRKALKIRKPVKEERFREFRKSISKAY